MYDHIVTTMDRYDEAQKVNGIIMPTKIKGGLKEFQKVISVGSFVKNVKPGDMVCINPAAYGRPQHSNANSIKGLTEYEDTVNMVYNFPTVEVNGEKLLFISERDVEYIINEYDVSDENQEDSVVQVVSPLLT